MEGFEYRNPYAAPTAQVQVAPLDREDAELVRAGRLPRLLAQLCDAFVAVLALVPMLAGLATFDKGSRPGAAFAVLTLVSVLALIVLVVYQLVLLYRDGQTIGKRWIGIRIVRNDGDRASLLRILFLRGFVPGLIGGIPYVGWVFSLANLLWIFGEERRCLHDYFADTMVVNA